MSGHNCPTCGEPMMLHHSNNSRMWRCPNHLAPGSECNAEFLKPEERLEIAEIRDDMAARLFQGSDELRKNQTTIRRLAGGLRAQLDEQKRYLSEPERRSLMEAVEVLERLGTAAEQAKKQKKRLEQAEELRRAARRREASVVLKKRFRKDLPPREFIPLFCGLGQVVMSGRRFPATLWDSLTQDNRVGGVEWEMRYGADTFIDEALSDIAYSQKPVQELLDKLNEAVTAAMETNKDEWERLVDEVEVHLVQKKLEASNGRVGE